MTELKINYPKPIEIIIEFPISVLSQYRGGDNLDETWDDNIMPIIHGALLEHNIHIKQRKLDFVNNAKNKPETLCYSMELIVPPPLFSFTWIVNPLKESCFEKGLCIKLKTDYGNYEMIYSNFEETVNKPIKNIEKQSLILPDDWIMTYNEFYDIDPSEINDWGDISQSCFFKEDMLQIKNNGKNLLLDLGWYPEFKKEGRYCIHLIEDYNWEKPLVKKHTKSKTKTLKIIEDILLKTEAEK